MEKQYIYIFSNSQYPEIVKVGKTNIHPEVRAKQLSSQTGSVGKWQVEWYMVVPDSDIAEKMAHSLLKEFREDPKKEFFKRTVFEASSINEKKLIEFFEIEKPEIWEGEKLKEEKKQKQLLLLKAKLARETAKLELSILKF
jgi:hypothetical protein